MTTTITHQIGIRDLFITNPRGILKAFKNSIIDFHDPTGGLPAEENNARYISTATANDWQENGIYTFLNEWIEEIPSGGELIWVEDSEDLWIFNANVWSPIQIGTSAPPSTDNAIARFNGLSGQLQNSGVLLDDDDNLSGINDLTMDGKLTVGGLIDPTGLELVPVENNPGITPANTIWLDDTGVLRRANNFSMESNALPNEGDILTHTQDSIYENTGLNFLTKELRGIDSLVLDERNGQPDVEVDKKKIWLDDSGRIRSETNFAVLANSVPAVGAITRHNADGVYEDSGLTFVDGELEGSDVLVLEEGNQPIGTLDQVKLWASLNKVVRADGDYIPKTATTRTSSILILSAEGVLSDSGSSGFSDASGSFLKSSGLQIDEINDGEIPPENTLYRDENMQFRLGGIDYRVPRFIDRAILDNGENVFIPFEAYNLTVTLWGGGGGGESSGVGGGEGGGGGAFIVNYPFVRELWGPNDSIPYYVAQPVGAGTQGEDTGFGGSTNDFELLAEGGGRSTIISAGRKPYVGVITSDHIANGSTGTTGGLQGVVGASCRGRYVGGQAGIGDALTVGGGGGAGFFGDGGTGGNQGANGGNAAVNSGAGGGGSGEGQTGGNGGGGGIIITYFI